MKKPAVRVPSNQSGPVFSSDGLRNFVSGLGTGADKSSFDTYSYMVAHNQAEIDAAYRTSWFKKIVHIPAEDAVRAGITWQAEGDQIEKLEAESNRLALWPKIMQALILARKDGDSAVYMQGLAGDPAMPAIPGKLRNLVVLQRWEINPGERETEIEMPGYGDPKYYMIGNARIHPSRIVRFYGNRVYGQAWDGHGDSIWTVMREAILNSDRIATAVGALIHEAKTDIMKIKGFMNGMATAQYRTLMTERMALVNTMASLINSKVIDADDDSVQRSYSFGGVSDVWDRALLVMGGMADIPATRLLGRSPAGMNATGDSDMKNYYANVEARQRLEITPAVHPLMEAIIYTALGSRDPAVYYEWNPLGSPTEKESAEVEKMYADGLVARTNTGLFDDRVLAKAELNRMTESGMYPGIEAAIDESDEEDGIKDPDDVEAAEIERMTIQAQAVPRVAANDGDE